METKYGGREGHLPPWVTTLWPILRPRHNKINLSMRTMHDTRSKIQITTGVMSS